MPSKTFVIVLKKLPGHFNRSNQSISLITCAPVPELSSISSTMRFPARPLNGLHYTAHFYTIDQTETIRQELN